MVFGLALVLALVFGVNSMAFGANGNPFLLGKKNVASAVSKLVKQGPGPALSLVVGAGQPPLAVNSPAKVAHLNADKVDGTDSTALLPGGHLPSGRTIRGNYTIYTNTRPSSNGLADESISFGYELTSAPTLHIVKAGTTAPSECPGTVDSPEAAPGYLCVYESDSGNLATNRTYPASLNVNRTGANLFAYSAFNSSTSADMSFWTYGTWAVTGN
jgi:hypothetical protein